MPDSQGMRRMRLDRLKVMHHRIPPCIIVGLLMLMAVSAHADALPRLVSVKRTSLVKAGGRIDQAVPVLGGGFLIRDADFLKEATQALEVYDASGRFLRKIGGYGPRPGSYQALKQIALGTDGTVWVADLIGRLSLFDLGGRLQETKLIQAPGYQVEGIALDEPRGLLYLSGCLPKETSLEHGCKVVHQYRLKERKFLRSFADNDPKIGQNNLISFSDNALDVDGQGKVWVVDAPVLKLTRVDPAAGKSEGFAIRSNTAKPLEKVEPGADVEALFKSAYLLERVVAIPAGIVVSVRGPNGAYLLEVFDAQGRQVAVDLQSPGKLVGKTRGGHLLFATPVKSGFEIGEVSLELPGR